MAVAGIIINLLQLFLRVTIGGAMVYAGCELLSGTSLLSGTQFDSLITGIFVILLGFYCILFGVYNNFYRYFCCRRQWK